MANQEHINWLLEGAEAWNERIQQEGMGFKPDLSGVNVWEIFRNAGQTEHRARPDLSNYMFQFADFQDANIGSTTLNGANFLSADFRGAFVYDSTLRSAQLYNADFRNAKVWGVDFTQAELGRAKFEGAAFGDCILINLIYTKQTFQTSIFRVQGYGNRTSLIILGFFTCATAMRERSDGPFEFLASKT